MKTNLKAKVLSDLIDKLHLLPEAMAETSDGEKEDKPVDEKAAALAVLLGKEKSEEEEEE